MDQQELIERLIFWTLLVVSLTVHEWAHAWSAYKLGDDTAAMMGRMTFNPLVHLDMIGTVILPLLGAPIGWAKPVPVQPHRFRSNISMSWGMLLTAIAGPISNIVLAVLGVLLFAASTHLAAQAPEFVEMSTLILVQFIWLNLALAVFNMLPIPPLDGSRVLNHFMPRALRPAWEQFQEYGFFILLGVVLLMRYTGSNALAVPIQAMFQFLIRLASPLFAGGM